MNPNTMLMVAPDALDKAIEAVADEQLPITERGAIYAGLRRLRLQIDRALRPVTKEIELAMTAANAKEWGPLRLSWKAIDPKYPVNDEGNWDDAIVQGTLAEWWRQSAFRPFIRKIPAHYEIDVAGLGKAVANGDPGARELYGELNRQRLRTEEGRSPYLSVTESRAA
jgi:hypothetical protein